MYGGRAEERIMGLKTVVVTGRYKLRGGTVSGGSGYGGTMEG